MSTCFKECPCCHEQWKELTDFAFDSYIELNGHQANTESPLEGYFVFTHSKPTCLSTFLVQIKEFLYLNSDIVTISKFIPISKECLGTCKDPSNLKECSNPHCKAKQIKKILTIINMRDKAIIKKLDQ